MKIRDLGIDCFQLADNNGAVSKYAIYTAAELVELHTAIGRMIVDADTLLPSRAAHDPANWTADAILRREG